MGHCCCWRPVAATPSTDPYNNGTSVSLTATANNGYKFTNWGGDAGSGTNPQVSVTMNANKSVTATFAQLFTVTYSGTGAPVDNNKYQTGDSVTVLGAGSLVNSGFTLWGWTLNGVMYKIGAKFKMGSSNVTLLPSWVVMDREGNIYDTVTINGTIWLKQNLKTRSITLGNPILCRSASAWAANSSTPKCCFYGFLDNDNYGVGAFYNAAAITSMSNLAPDGWHIATVNDFDNLMPSGDAKSIAVPGTDYWLHDYGTNSTGFSAVGSGYCDSTGFFNGYQQETFFWASSGVDAAELYIYKEVTFLMNRFQMTNIGLGYSVRCVKNP